MMSLGVGSTEQLLSHRFTENKLERSNMQTLTCSTTRGGSCLTLILPSLPHFTFSRDMEGTIYTYNAVMFIRGYVCMQFYVV